MSGKKGVDRGGGGSEISGNGEKTVEGKEATATETREHRVEGAKKRDMHLMELLRDGLFSQWHISVARKETVRGDRKKKSGRIDGEIAGHSQEGRAS